MALIHDSPTKATHKVSDVAAALSCSEKTVYRYVASGEWPHTWVGRRLRFSDDELTKIKALWVRPVPATERRAG